MLASTAASSNVAQSVLSLHQGGYLGPHEGCYHIICRDLCPRFAPHAPCRTPSGHAHNQTTCSSSVQDAGARIKVLADKASQQGLGSASQPGEHPIAQSVEQHSIPGSRALRGQAWANEVMGPPDQGFTASGMASTDLVCAKLDSMGKQASRTRGAISGRPKRATKIPKEFSSTLGTAESLDTGENDDPAWRRKKSRPTIPETSGPLHSTLPLLPVAQAICSMCRYLR